MEKIKKILKERLGGFFLLLFAVMIITGLFSGSRRVESKNEQNLANEEQATNDGQILGEMSNNAEEITTNSSEETINLGNWLVFRTKFD